MVVVSEHAMAHVNAVLARHAGLSRSGSSLGLTRRYQDIKDLSDIKMQGTKDPSDDDGRVCLQGFHDMLQTCTPEHEYLGANWA